LCLTSAPTYHNRRDLYLKCPVFGTGGIGRTAIQIGRGKLGHIRATAPTGQHLTPWVLTIYKNHPVGNFKHKY